MAELRQDEQSFSFGGNHLHAAGIAAVISALIHVVLVIVASQINLNVFSGGQAQSLPRKYEALHLESVEVDPHVQEQVLDTLRSVDGKNGASVAEAVDELSVPPEEGVTEPPALEDMEMRGDAVGLSEPTPPPVMSGVMAAKQEIIIIENTAVGDTLPNLERRIVPNIERVNDAPDIISQSSGKQIASRGSGQSGIPVSAPTAAVIRKTVVGGMDSTKTAPVFKEDKEAMPGGEKELFEETIEEVTETEPIERVLNASVQTYESARDKKYGYFKLDVKRAGDQLLPVRPKDIILVQDCSASMSEQRLYFCREGLRRALAHIGPADRFNVAKFADRTETCFDRWVEKTPETLEKAEAYINSMQAKGNTDLFASMNDLLTLDQRPERPVVAFVITDGLVNKGLTDNSEIIGKFSRENNGKISVFTLGTSQMANRYLIDLLSYCNKGYVNLVSKGRWDIPESVEKVMQGISRPVLADLHIQIPSESSCEIYPRQVSNLYLDRPLTLYGRYRKGEEHLLFQAVGQAGSTPCDLIFDLPLEGETLESDENIREKWAQRKIYHLIGEFTRTRDREVLKELRSTSKTYKQPIPYKRSLF